jgi:hypothetical protein
MINVFTHISRIKVVSKIMAPLRTEDRRKRGSMVLKYVAWCIYYPP